MSCTTTPKAVLRRGCWSQSQTTKLLFSKEKIKLKEPLESGNVDNDITSYEVIQGLLESGRALLLDVVPTDNNSTGVKTAEIGNNQVVLGQGEGRQTFHVKTGTPYLNNFSTYTGFKYGYMYAIQEDNSIRAIQELVSGVATGSVYPLELNEVTPHAPTYFNDGQNVNSILIDITFEAVQTFGTVDYGLQFKQSSLEQRFTLDSGDVTMAAVAAANVILTDATANLIEEDYSGTTGDGYVTLKVDGLEVDDVDYTVSGSTITIDHTCASAEVIDVTVDKDSVFWAAEFYGVELSATVA